MEVLILNIGKGLKKKKKHNDYHEVISILTETAKFFFFFFFFKWTLRRSLKRDSGSRIFRNWSWVSLLGKGLDQITSTGLFLPQPFCDYVAGIPGFCGIKREAVSVISELNVHHWH